MKIKNGLLTISLGLLFCYLYLVCSSQGANESQHLVTFTRLGIVIEARNDGSKSTEVLVKSETDSNLVLAESIDNNRLFLKVRWKPNTLYHICADVIGVCAHSISPFKPSAYQIRTIELSNILPLLANLKQPAKPTTVAFSPGGDRLAIASDAGHLAVFKPMSGEKIWTTRISEGYIKHATFGLNGERLYIGEQSGDGFVYAYDLSAPKPSRLWMYRTADDIDTSRPENPNDVYAWVQYPGPYRISIIGDGDVVVAANHSWNRDGVSLRKSQLYRFDGKTGELKWKWPQNQPLLMTIKWFDHSHDGKTIAIVCDNGTHTMTPRHESGTLYVIDGGTGDVRWDYTFDPLRPYYQEVTFWRGVSISPNGKFISISTDDGRAFIFNAAKSENLWRTDLTTPIKISGIPITATAATIDSSNNFAIFVTGDTFVPHHLQKGAQQPPSAHPNGLTLFAYSWTGEKVWRWELENMPQGLCIDNVGRYAAVSQSKSSRNINEQLHGVSVFDLEAQGGSLSKYLYTYRTRGKIPYDTIDISANGELIAVIESPLVMPDETARGKHRVHILQ